VLDFAGFDPHIHGTIIEFGMANKPQIILASASPRREQLLREMGLRFTVVQPVGVEEVNAGAAPDVLAIQNAQRKARAVAGRHPDEMVIGADTVVVLDGTIFGKPHDHNEAVRMLEQLAGHQHEVITGVCLLHRGLDTELTFADTTRVWMRPLTKAQIQDYLSKINPLDKAGAYAIQEHGAGIVEHIEGSYENVMGLPTERLRATFQRIGMVNCG
jgi:septum formation protein